MKKKGNAGSRLAIQRLTALGLALLTLMSCMGTAFAGIGAESVLLPESVKEVAADAFGDCEKLTAFIVCGAETEIDNEALMGSANVTVYAPAGSLAQTFAEDNRISFIPLLNQAG